MAGSTIIPVGCLGSADYAALQIFQSRPGPFKEGVDGALRKADLRPGRGEGCLCPSFVVSAETSVLRVWSAEQHLY